MKFTLFLCLLPALVTAQIKLHPVEQSCLDQEGATEEDAEMLRVLMEPEERTTKCYYSCVLRLFRYSDGRRFDKKGYLLSSEGQPERNRQMMQIIADRCEGTKNEDHCELAADIVKCIMNRG